MPLGLQVITRYSPKFHRLNFLRSRAEEIAPALIDVWPRADEASCRAFGLLREAYVNARYAPDYAIGEDELVWLDERNSMLQNRVRAVSERRLA